ncbi:hypothetical protein MMC26_005898 [Xylographa opegraphella]|nr:hypothetical protein [Xylographa opegraphella]
MPPSNHRGFFSLLLLLLLLLLSFLLYTTTASLTLTPSSPPPAPPSLSPRATTSTPISTCTAGYIGWTFQQSFCQRAYPRSVRAWRMQCHRPGARSMLEGPVPWWQMGSVTGECLPSQLCVDGPYTPPNEAMMRQHWWYKQYGTAYCVEIEYLVGLGTAGLEVMAAQVGKVGEGGIYPPGKGEGIFA